MHNDKNSLGISKRYIQQYGTSAVPTEAHMRKAENNRTVAAYSWIYYYGTVESTFPIMDSCEGESTETQVTYTSLSLLWIHT